MPAYRIREARTQDAAALIAHLKRVADEPDNGISLASADEFITTEAEEAEIIERLTAADNALLLVAEADGHLIGVASCRGGERGYYHTLMLAITVSREWRNQGVGTALLRHMIDWCAANPLVHKLELWVFPDNPRAIHVYEKLGFQHEGHRRACFLKAGQFLDLLLMGMVFE